MEITSREKAIIELIIKTSGKHTAMSIASSLNVSTRTIQRDLKSVEKIFNGFQLMLTRNTNQGLVIEGKNEQIFKLMQYVAKSGPIDESSQEKKLRLLLAIMDEQLFKIQALSNHLGISTVTLSIYMDELAEWLRNFNIQLTRKRGVGVELDGTEANQRRALVHFYLQYFHEELIEKMFLLNEGQLSNDRILHYFIPEYLSEVSSIVNSDFSSFQGSLADNSYLEMILQISITLQRIEKQFFIGKDQILKELDVTNELHQMKRICSALELKFKVDFSEGDLLYLALVQKGTKLRGTETVPYDSIVLAQKIRNVIKNVSDQLHIDLTKDFSLFQGLIAHMGPSLFRLQQKMESFNPLKTEIKQKYPFLFIAVKKSVETEFNEIDDFPDDEIAFIVLHFGSALVMQEENLLIKALVICPTGIGTSKMLASRIKKEIPEIDFIEIKPIKDITDRDELNAYDIIISTVRLPFMIGEYILVNPLLREENITSIKSFLQRNIQTLTDGKYQLLRAQKPTPSKHVELSVLLDDIKNIQQSIKALIDNFRFYRMENEFSQEKMLEYMLRMAEKERLLSNSEDVLQSLKERERKGGLGIPDTNLALFHARNKHIKTPIFQITHLPKPLMVKGMDGNSVGMKNLLLLLAPLELSEREQEILSLISTSIIESDENILVFSSANEEMIHMKLEAVFTDYLQNVILK